MLAETTDASGIRSAARHRRRGRAFSLPLGYRIRRYHELRIRQLKVISWRLGREMHQREHAKCGRRHELPNGLTSLDR